MGRARIVCGLAVVLGAGFAWPSAAHACSCIRADTSSIAIHHAELVFVGRVARVEGPKPWSRTNRDGSTSFGMTSGPSSITFEAVRPFKGALSKEIVVRGDGCHLPFQSGETWLVYARAREGLVETGSCSRTRLLAEATQDMRFLEGLEQGRRQGVLYGDVHRRIVKDGASVLQALFETLHIIAAGAAGRFSAPTDKWGPYQLVLPPGEYDVWAERDGRAVTPRQSVRIEHGSERRLQLAAEYTETVDGPQALPDTPNAALERAEARWRERGPKSYTYGVLLTCLCSPKGMDFRVVDGQPQLPEKATAATKGFHDAYGTVEALFAKIRRTIHAGGHRVAVKYHDEFGYPISADLDPSKNVIDDEVFIRLTGFRVTSRHR